MDVFPHALLWVVVQPAAVRFHENHGTNIVLSNDNQTAERISGIDHGIVMCRYPMLINRMYEVQMCSV